MGLLALPARMPVRADQAPAAATPDAADATCGDGSGDGVLLYQAFDRPMAPSDPPARRGARPRVITPLPFGCCALVRSRTGPTYLVGGATGDARELPLKGPVDEFSPWEYQPIAGGRRWAC